MTEATDPNVSDSGTRRDPPEEPLHADTRRHTQRGIALVAAAVAAPPVFGFGAAVFAETVMTMPPGMDSYVPLFMGMAGGAVLGLVLLLAGIAQLVMAWRMRKIAAKLLD